MHWILLFVEYFTLSKAILSVKNYEKEVVLYSRFFHFFHGLKNNFRGIPGFFYCIE